MDGHQHSGGDAAGARRLHVAGRRRRAARAGGVRAAGAAAGAGAARGEVRGYCGCGVGGTGAGRRLVLLRGQEQPEERFAIAASVAGSRRQVACSGASAPCGRRAISSSSFSLPSLRCICRRDLAVLLAHAGEWAQARAELQEYLSSAAARRADPMDQVRRGRSTLQRQVAPGQPASCRCLASGLISSSSSGSCRRGSDGLLLAPALPRRRRCASS